MKSRNFCEDSRTPPKPSPVRNMRRRAHPCKNPRGINAPGGLSVRTSNCTSGCTSMRTSICTSIRASILQCICRHCALFHPVREDHHISVLSTQPKGPVHLIEGKSVRDKLRELELSGIDQFRRPALGMGIDKGGGDHQLLLEYLIRL